MGRHSAPDGPDVDAADGAADNAAVGAADGAADDAATMILTRWTGLTGRHAVIENVGPIVEPILEVHQTDLAADEQATLVIPIGRARPEQPPEQVKRRPAVGHDGVDRRAAAKQGRLERKQARWQQGTGADLRMLRQNTAIRLQCMAAVLIAFGGYTAVMGVLGQDSRSYLMWVWVPIVLSGVLVGACLDVAHVRAARQAAAREEPDPGTAPEIQDRRRP